MQKVLQRTARAKAQAARRAAKQLEKQRSAKATTERREAESIRKSAVQDIRNARIARREDRELGPLAPRRDVGDLKDTYGTMNSSRLRGTIKRPEDRKDAQLIVVGDRVVIIEGRDKGRIGQVSSVDRKRHEAVVKGLNMVRVELPPDRHRNYQRV